MNPTHNALNCLYKDQKVSIAATVADDSLADNNFVMLAVPYQTEFGTLDINYRLVPKSAVKLTADSDIQTGMVVAFRRPSSGLEDTGKIICMYNDRVWLVRAHGDMVDAHTRDLRYIVRDPSVIKQFDGL